MQPAVPVAMSLLAASLFAGGGASAYQLRKTTGGVPVHWDSDTITVVADASLSALGPDAISAATRAFAAWSEVQGADGPGVVLVDGVADELGYREGDENKNTLRYEPDGYAPAGGALAITVLTFDSTGKIVDADIVINGGGSHGFAVLPGGDPKKGVKNEAVGGSYDVEDVLTHEAGHFFGLAHSDAGPEATMYFATARGEIKKRDLSLDDESGFRSIYPEARAFTAACSVSPGAGSSGPGLAAAALLATAIVLVGRRRANLLDL